MAKRLMCIVLSFLMIMTVLPTGVVGAGETTGGGETDNIPFSGTLERVSTSKNEHTLTGTLIADNSSGNQFDMYTSSTISYSGVSGDYVIEVKGTLELFVRDNTTCYITANSSCKAVIYSYDGLSSAQLIEGVSLLDSAYNYNLNIVANGGAYGIIMGSGAVAKIETGTITVNSADAYAVYCENGGTANISGGYFKNTVGSTLIGCASGGTVSITGGYFYGTDLAAVAAEIGPYVANGYELTTATVSDTTYVTVQAATTTYTLTYNANNSSDETITVPFASGTSTAIASGDIFTYDGYTFNSWNTASDGTGTSYAAGDSITISSDTTLYAQWIADTWVEYTNVRNGYDLAVGFYIPKSKLDSSYTVKVTFNVATYSNGWVKTPATVEIDSSEWTEDTVGSTEYWVIIYEGIWAMQYAEDITIDIYDSNGNKVCASYTDSIAEYEERYVEKYSSYTSAVNLANALLSYCSAARTYYGY